MVDSNNPVSQQSWSRQVHPSAATDLVSQHSNSSMYNKRFNVKACVAACLAALLVIVSMMYASDKYNLFTRHPASSTSNQAAGQNINASWNNGSGGSGAVKNAAMQRVVRPNDIAQIVKKSSPAVVKVMEYVHPAQQQTSNPFYSDPFFRQFYGNNSAAPKQQSSSPLVEKGLGSGFIFDQSGYILTNDHVVNGAAQVKVQVQGHSKPYVAKVLGTSFDLDLAVLKIKGNHSFPTLPIDTNINSNLQVGNWLIAIGNPYGYDHTVTVGVLSAKGRPINITENHKTRHYTNLLQTDAAINPGNSGGPLLNLQGQVVGINTAVNAQAQGIGFAIPASTIMQNIDQLKNNIDVSVPQPFIGAAVTDVSNVTQGLQKQLGLNSDNGAMITSVAFGSPAYTAGLREYDVIIKVDGKPTKNAKALVKMIHDDKVGQTVKLTVLREGKSIQIPVTIGNKSNSQQ